MLIINIKNKKFVSFEDTEKDKKEMTSPSVFSDRRIEAGAWTLTHKRFGKIVLSGWVFTIDEEGNIKGTSSSNPFKEGENTLTYQINKDGEEILRIKTPEEEKCLKKRKVTSGIFEGRLLIVDSALAETENVLAQKA